MSINFSFGKTPYYMDGNYIWDPNREGELIAPAAAIVWYAHTVGVPRLTEANVERFLDRCAAWDAVNGFVISVRDPETNEWKSAIDPEFTRRCVGFSTNATAKTAAQFTKSLFKGKQF